MGSNTLNDRFEYFPKSPLEKAVAMKNQGNAKFREQKFSEAIDAYTSKFLLFKIKPGH